MLYNIERRKNRIDTYLGEELSHGDIERAQLEWRSLKTHIAYAPDYDWDRWMSLKKPAKRPSLKQPELSPSRTSRSSPNSNGNRVAEARQTSAKGRATRHARKTTKTHSV